MKLHNLQLLSVESKDDGVIGDGWAETIQLAEKLDVCPALLATKELIARLVGGEMCAERAVSVAGHLQNKALLDHRLFTSSIVKVEA